MKTVNDYATLVMVMVRADQAVGIVPAEVRSFGEIHGYVDANDYLQDAGVPFGTDEGSGQDGCGTVNAVCALVSGALAAGLCSVTGARAAGMT